MPVLTSTGPTPSAGTVLFSTLKTDIATYYGLDKDPDKVGWIGRQAHDVIDDLNRKKLWRFNLIASDNITTVSGTDTYSLPSNLFKLYSVRKQDSIDFLLSGLEQRMFDILFQSQSGITGYPYLNVSFNLFRDGTLKLFPTPDGTYTILIRYFRLISKPGDDEFLDIPEPYQSVLKYGTLARIAMLVGEDPRYWEGKFQEAYQEMNLADEDDGDQDLRLINIDEIRSRGTDYLSPNVRPRFLDLY